jgi:hypothetical protein
VDGRQHDALERRGVGRALARLKLGVEEALVDLVADPDQRIPVLFGEHAADAEVAGVVDGRFGPQRAALFEVLLDLRGAVVDLDRGLHAAGDDLGVKPAGGAAGDAAAEHDRDLIGASECQLIGERALEPRAARGWPVEHARVGDLELPERELIPIPTSAVLRGERRRQPRLPAIEERAHV